MAAPATPAKNLYASRVGSHSITRGIQDRDEQSGATGVGRSTEEITAPSTAGTAEPERFVTLPIGKHGGVQDYFGAKSLSPSGGPNIVVATRQSSLSPAASRILRFQLSKSILKNLETLGQVAQQHSCATPAAGVMRDIIRFRNELPNDHLTDVLIALYDAMVSQDRWSHYTGEQYEKALQILRGLLAETNLRHDKVKRAITALESTGFVVAIHLNDYEAWAAWGDDDEETSDEDVDDVK